MTYAKMVTMATDLPPVSCYTEMIVLIIRSAQTIYFVNLLTQIINAFMQWIKDVQLINHSARAIISASLMELAIR